MAGLCARERVRAIGLYYAQGKESWMKMRKRRRHSPEIPLASMSDLAMLLLIFFIVTTQFLIQRSLDAELPAITDDEDHEQDPITVVVEDEGVFLDEDYIAMEELSFRLAEKLVDRPAGEGKAVILDARPAVRYAAVVQAANEIVRAGGLVTFHKVED